MRQVTETTNRMAKKLIVDSKIGCCRCVSYAVRYD